jgi:K+-sensing histidine kinase KdpD
LGLGLTICRGIIEAHSGTIAASSPGEGQGAIFVVRLPLFTQLFQGQYPTTDGYLGTTTHN